jgi:hypothetical protein
VEKYIYQSKLFLNLCTEKTMQITVGKNGTKIKLTKAEERLLTKTPELLGAIAQHPDVKKYPASHLRPPL